MNNPRKGSEDGENMADMQNMIKTILTRVYRDEPIPRNAAQVANLVPPKYREMRKIAYRSSLHREPDAKLFYEQAKFMENFEDDFDYRGEFVRYFPTYQSMTDVQLRGYFSWRTKVRRGTIEKTSLSFAFIYIYELLNGIGTRSPEESFRALENFRAAYGALDDRIERYLKVWMRDYVVYYDLDKSLFGDRADADFDETVLTLLNHRSHETNEVFAALCALSSYKIESSRFFKRHPDDVRDVACRVFAALSDDYGENHGGSDREKFFGKIYTNAYTMFRSAVFYDRIKREDFVYEISDLYLYRCRDGSWSSERFFCYKGKIQRIGALLKSIDYLMRRKYGFKSTLKADKTTRAYQAIIEREIERNQEAKRIAAQPRIEIDVSALQSIREAALQTQSRLVVEGTAEMDIPEISDETDEKTGGENEAGLSDAECRFLRCLLRGEPYDDLVRSQGLTTSLLVDAINEKLFERFGDTVLAYDGEKPAPVEDYMDELRGIIGT